MKIRSLAIITLVLGIISGTIYFFENRRNTELVSGSEFIKGLDLNTLDKVQISFQEGKKLVFNKEGNHFFIESYKGHPAGNSQVNDLIYKLASTEIKEKVAEAKDDLSPWELTPEKRNFYVELFDAQGAKTMAFSVGKSDKGQGQYLLKDGAKTVYASSNPLWIDPNPLNYVDKKLFQIDLSSVEKITVGANRSVTLAKDGENVPGQELLNTLNEIEIAKINTPSDSEVSTLAFTREVVVNFDSKLTYKIQIAAKDKSIYLQLAASVEELPQQVVISKDDDQKKLEGVEKMLKSNQLAEEFNFLKGRWIYQLNAPDAEKLLATLEKIVK